MTMIPVFPPTTPEEHQAYQASIVRSLVIAHQDRHTHFLASGDQLDDDGHLRDQEAA